MPNKKGFREPNGTWDEDTPHRREQKRLAAARLRERRRHDQKWLKTVAAQKAASRARIDPNKAREKKQEQRFRWHRPARRSEGTHSAVTRAHLERPEFVVIQPRTGVRFPEAWETAEELENRLRKKGDPTPTKHTGRESAPGHPTG